MPDSNIFLKCPRGQFTRLCVSMIVPFNISMTKYQPTGQNNAFFCEVILRMIFGNSSIQSPKMVSIKRMSLWQKFEHFVEPNTKNRSVASKSSFEKRKTQAHKFSHVHCSQNCPNIIEYLFAVVEILGYVKYSLQLLRSRIILTRFSHTNDKRVSISFALIFQNFSLLNRTLVNTI